MEIVVERVGPTGHVHEDHAHATGVLDHLRLLGAGVASAIADHDVAGDLRGVEGAGQAELRIGGSCGGIHGGDRRTGDRLPNGTLTEAPACSNPSNCTVPSQVGMVEAATVVYQGDA